MNAHGGYTLSFRRKWDNPVFNGSKQQAAVWAWMCDTASHNGTELPTKFGAIRLDAGELVIAERAVAEDFGLDRFTLRALFARMRAAGMIDFDRTRATRRAGTVVKIINYEAYQNYTVAEGTTATAKPTAKPENSNRKTTETPTAYEIAETRATSGFQAVDDDANNRKNDATATAKTENANRKANQDQVSKIISNTPVTTNTPGGAGGARKAPGGWSPKVNHPDQPDMIDWLAARPKCGPAPITVELGAAPLEVGAPMSEAPTLTGGNVVSMASGKGRVRQTGSPEFDEFYRAYPRHKNPDDARKAYAAALRRGATHAELMAGLGRLLAEVDGKDPRYIPYPASWLNAGGWKNQPDAPAPPRATMHNGRPMEAGAAEFLSEYAAAKRRVEGWQ